MVSKPPSTSRVTVALPSATTTLDAKVACGISNRLASIWPVWLLSSSIACLPRMMIWADSFSERAFRILATASGCKSVSDSTKMARSAPIAKAVRNVSWHCVTPALTTTTSVATPASFKRTASSTAISSKGFILILTFARSTPEPSDFTRILTL